MVVVRNVFIAKPGCASRLAAQLKAAAAGEIPGSRILTDMTGEFNRVVLEYEVPSVADWATQMQDYATNERLREAMKGYTELFIGGHRELLQTV